jgi:NhaP-type Na+/H+ or K+/H+ antiporter
VSLLHTELWFISIGLLLIIMTMITASLKHLPLTAAIFYLGFGILLGPAGVGLIRLNPVIHARIVEHLTEVAVIISLFTAGLKLRMPLTAPEWRIPFLMASLSMVATVALITLFGIYVYSLPLGAAVLLGAILAPTDPVLASNVQVLGPEDRDRLRFSLTGEAGLNDGTSFPFVTLGLGLLGIGDLGKFGWRWFFLDGVWAIAGGLAVGTLIATCISRLILYLRKKHEETQSLDDFLGLGLICITYGVALWLKTYGFLAVFAAGLALRRGERKETQSLDFVEDAEEPRPQWETASANLAHGVLTFNEQLERLGEIVVVLILGAMAFSQTFSLKYVWLALVLFVIIRPIAIALSTWTTERSQRRLLAWFGIRGIGSLYYLAYCIEKGVPSALANELVQVTFVVVISSILAHGVSSAPLMLRYSTKKAPP